MIDFTATSPDAWEMLCIEQFQLCKLDWAPASFDAGLRASASIPELSLRLLASGPFGVSRSSLDVRRHDSDDIMVVLHEAGRGGRVDHRGRCSELHPGDVVVVDTQRPYAFDYQLPIEQAVLKVPRALASRIIPEAGRIVRPGESPLGRVLSVVVRELMDLDNGSQVGQSPAPRDLEAVTLAIAAVDLISAIYAAQPARSSELLGHEALLRAAQDFVRARFWDSRLTPSLIAEHLRVSPRLVSQLFSRAGTTPAAFIRDVRLEEAARLLQSPRHRQVPIFDIGLRVGFPDATTFTRAFKRVRGVLPSEFRAMALLGGTV